MPRVLSTRPLCDRVVVTTSIAFGMKVAEILKCAGLPATDTMARFPMRVRKASIRRCVWRRMH